MPVYKEDRGTWRTVYRFTDWTGKRVMSQKRGFATKKDAKLYEAELMKKAHGDPEMTMGSLCQLYLDDIRTRRKPTTVYSEECMIRRHILPHLANLPVNQITVSTIRSWQNTVMKAPAIYSKKPLSQHTLRNINICLSSILNYAVRFHGLPSNPIKIAKGMGKTISHVEFWEEDEYERFMSVIEDENDRLYFSVLFTSGMRLGEFLALTPKDIDYRKRTISITKTYNWKLKYTSSPKTETSVRTITMPKAAIDGIKAYLKRLPETPDRIFEFVTQKRLTAMMKKYAAKAGVKTIRLHDLRHSHASFLIHRGVPITAISQRLGHKSPKITLEVYSHVYNASDQQIASVLENL